MKNWKSLGTEELLRNKWISVKKTQYHVGNGVVLDDYYVVERNDYVVLVANANDHLLFLEQYRPGVDRTILNLPMGLIEPGENPVATARRELLEETGFRTSSLKALGTLDLAPSFMNTRAHVFFAHGLYHRPGEEVDRYEGHTRVLRFSVRGVRDMIRDGRISDLSSCAAILLARDSGLL